MNVDSIVFYSVGVLYFLIAIMLTDIKTLTKEEFAIKVFIMVILIISAITAIVLGGIIA